jgi:hypothetical protein
MMVFIDFTQEAVTDALRQRVHRIGQLLLRSNNYLDTQAAGSYNRRPLSPGTSAGTSARSFFIFAISRAH